MNKLTIKPLLTHSCTHAPTHALTRQPPTVRATQGLQVQKHTKQPHVHFDVSATFQIEVRQPSAPTQLQHAAVSDDLIRLDGDAPERHAFFLAREIQNVVVADFLVKLLGPKVLSHRQ